MNEATTRSDREGGITRRRRARGGGTGGEGVGGKWALRGTQVERLGYSGSAVFRGSLNGG